MKHRNRGSLLVVTSIMWPPSDLPESHCFWAWRSTGGETPSQAMMQQGFGSWTYRTPIWIRWLRKNKLFPQRGVKDFACSPFQRGPWHLSCGSAYVQLLEVHTICKKVVGILASSKCDLPKWQKSRFTSIKSVGNNFVWIFFALHWNPH